MSVAGQAVSPVEQRRTPASHRSDEEDQVRVKRRTLQEVLEQCQRALESLKNSDQDPNAALEFDGVEDGESSAAEEASADEEPCARDLEADELCELIKSKVDSPTFLEKLGSRHMPVSHNISDNTASLDLVMDTGSWENVHVDVEKESDPDDYVLVSQEDIVEGISCFMAAYLLSLNQAKELTPTQLQEALSKTFSVKKRKSKLRKAWDGSKVIYNVASWGATAIGLYQNPAVFRVASVVFWSSCRVISKFL